MANTVTFSVGGSGGGGSNIKSIQHVSFSLSRDKFSEIPDIWNAWFVTIPLENVINPDKSIIITPHTICGCGTSTDVSGTKIWVYRVVLSSIESNSITLNCIIDDSGYASKDPITEITWEDYINNTIQIIEFE